MRRAPLLLLALPLLGAECPTATRAPERIPAGVWGGEHVALTVSDSDAVVEYDCAHGRIAGPLAVDARGAFALDGILVREHGGPVREGEAADAHAARYAGTLAGDRLTFVVTTLDDGARSMTYVATRGAAGRVFKCL